MKNSNFTHGGGDTVKAYIIAGILFFVVLAIALYLEWPS
jgi:hypothetical protein